MKKVGWSFSIAEDYLNKKLLRLIVFSFVYSKVKEEIVLKMAYEAKRLPTQKSMFIGGVALNCVANGILLWKYFENIYIQPAAETGISWAAQSVYYQYYNSSREVDGKMIWCQGLI